MEKQYSNHIIITSIVGKCATLRLPESYLECCHQSHTGTHLLGAGTYGRVFVNPHCHGVVKEFDIHSNFYHELLADDLVAMAAEKCNSYDNYENIIKLTGACAPCKIIFYDRYSTSLDKYDSWSGPNMTRIVQEFHGLLKAITFLNEECGLFHSDISPCNILVQHGSNSKFLEKLVLSDLGISSLHSGNRVTDMVLKSSKGRLLYRMFYRRDPFFVCKDVYKPACVLSRCYTICLYSSRKASCVTTDAVGKAMAMTIDVSSLAYCLLFVIERTLDSLCLHPSRTFYDTITDSAENPKYYLQFMVPKVVMLEFLSDIWNIKFNLGLDSKGNCQHIIIEPSDLHVFTDWCKAFKTTFDLSFMAKNITKLQRQDLKDMFQHLITYDSFSLENYED